MKLLILVKHSLPEIVENVPAREWNLSEEGRRRVPILVEKLVQYQPGVIVSSVEPKAQQTATILAESLGLKSQTFEGLHEHDRSNSPLSSKEEFQALVQKFFEKPSTLVFGNETADQAYVRFHQAVEAVLNLYRGKTVLIVAHGTVISLYVSRLTGIDGYDLWKNLGLPSFVLFDIESKALLKIENIL